MNRFNRSHRASVLVLLLSTLIPCLAVAVPQGADESEGDTPKAPALTDTVRCTVDHAVGCSWEKPHCTDGDSVLADVSGAAPTFYELDLLKQVAQLKGNNEQHVLIQIDRISFTPDSGVINVEGVNEGWMPWTLSYNLSNGKGFVTQTAPEFTSLYLVSCVVVNDS